MSKVIETGCSFTKLIKEKKLCDKKFVGADFRGLQHNFHRFRLFQLDCRLHFSYSTTSTEVV